MKEMFYSVVNMSLTASYVILLVILVRFFLKKAPKVISYALWSVVFFRLICPMTLSFPISVIPSGLLDGHLIALLMDDYVGETKIFHDNTEQYKVAVASGRTPIDAGEGASYVVTDSDGISYPKTVGSAVTPVLISIWLTGIAVMLIYSIVSALILKKRLKGASEIEHSIYEADNLKTPFVLGIFRPKIFIPSGLTEKEKCYVIKHEQTHIKRFDYIIKPLVFLVLSIHWFNPLVWIAFVLMGADMELSCDERVIKEMGFDIKKAYSASLLSMATNKRIINGSPLAFGEGNVSGRIKNVLDYKKPTFWVAAVAVIAVISVGVGLMTNPVNKTAPLSAETFKLTSSNNDMVSFETDVTTYSSSFTAITATLTNEEMESGLMCGKGFSLVKQVGDEWRTIPFAKGTGFTTVAIGLAIGESERYTLTPDMLTGALEAGTYRIVTYISYASDTPPQKEHVVWAEFSIGERQATLTLDDIRELAQKGEDLTFKDFEGFIGVDASSNLNYHIMVYSVEGGYRLIVRSDGKILDSTALESIWEIGGTGIDIRHEDIDAFIKSHPSHEDR